jgi:uncharacterized repeat protein (TIGR03803 family)
MRHEKMDLDILVDHSMPRHSMKSRQNCFQRAIILAVLFFALHGYAQVTLTTLVTFDGTNGFDPRSLIEGEDGNFYGVLSEGGWFEAGTVFRMSPDGKCVILVTFDGSNGAHPDSLIQGKDGNFYGTTLEGGPWGNGSIFKMTPDGTISTLATFGYLDGYGPWGLVQGKDGNLYGKMSTIRIRGQSDFEATLNGRLIIPAANGMPADSDGTNVVVFYGTNGATRLSGLIQGSDGNFYGITSHGGAFNQGTVFRLNLREASNAALEKQPKINVPILIHAVSNTINPIISNLWQKPIDFYGKIEDEGSNPIAGANVQFQWDDLTARDFTRTAVAKSDAEGLFSLVGKRGATLSVSVSKEGYYTPHDGQGSFRYAMGNPDFSPDPQNPVIFHLHKKGQGVSLIQTKFPPGMRIAQLHHDGTPVTLDLFNGTQVSEGSGQLELQLWRDISDRNVRKFDWKLQLSILGGGLVPTDEEFAFEAPQGGYQPSIVISMPATNQDWNDSFTARYYIQLPNGDYGRFDLNLSAYNGAFRAQSAINPTGSQNLEPVQ